MPSLSRMSSSVQSDGLPRRSVASRAFFKSAKRFLRISLRLPSLRPRKCSWRWPLAGWSASRSANAISALSTSSVMRRSSSIDRAAATALSKPSALSTASAQSNSRRLRSVSARAWASAFGGGVGIGSLIGSTMSPSFLPALSEMAQICRHLAAQPRHAVCGLQSDPLGKLALSLKPIDGGHRVRNQGQQLGPSG